ncbi:MAG TPA: LPS export ABC transporter periplasmic protein LptC [Casimicrobiaceae bacterium]|nr:LPS export ABC transporter periplasmic protein LptC [Casimicrobiaceae bacterium]
MAVDRRRRWLDRLSAWAPAFLLGALAALTWWLDAQVADPGARRNGNMRHDPDLVVDGVRIVELNSNGDTTQTLAAQRARHYPDDGTIEFDVPRVNMAQPGRPRFTVEAQKGRVSGDRENAYFEGKVRAVRDAEDAQAASDGPAGRMTLTTEFLHVIPREDRAQTHLPVTIEEPRGIIQANGLVLDNRSKSVQLKTGVRGTLAAPK